MKKLKIKLITLGIAAIACVLYWFFPETFSFMVEPDSHASHMAFQKTQEELEKGNKTIEQAFKTKTNGLQVDGIGSITQISADGEGVGSTQRFMVELTSGTKVEISHTVSQGHPPIRLLQVGGEISFSGTYEWSSAGGKIINTAFKKDAPSQSGWIKYNDILYQ